MKRANPLASKPPKGASGISRWVAANDLTALGQRLLQSANNVLARVPFIHINLTTESLRGAIAKVGQNVGEIALTFARDSVGGIATTVTSAVIFLYVFVALVVNGFCREVLQALPMEFAMEAQSLVAISLEGSVG